MTLERFARRAPTLGLALFLSLGGCTAITDSRIEKVVHCAGQADGTACGNEIDDGKSRICVGGACVVEGCGDGYLDTAAGEICDDGNTTPSDGCEPTCTYSCETNEQCDDMKVCTGTEWCDQTTHACVAGTPVTCTPSDECHASTCDEVTDGTCIESVIDDADHDGHVSKLLHASCGDDCNDGDPDIFPGHPEICGDGKDNNCANGTTDETTTIWYADCDRDGYALAAAKNSGATCAKPATTAASTGCADDNGDWTWRTPNTIMTRDCADNTAEAHPDDPNTTADDVTYHGNAIPGTSSYDWNCDGSWSQWDTSTTGFCIKFCGKFGCPVCDTSVSCCLPADSWWRDSVPACGDWGYREWCGDETMNLNCSADTWEQQKCL